MRAVAGLLAIRVLLDVGRGAGALGACRNAAIGVVGLVVTGTRNVEAFCSTANVLRLTCQNKNQYLDIQATVAGCLHFLAHSVCGVLVC